jgi:hypothetical protein
MNYKPIISSVVATIALSMLLMLVALLLKIFVNGIILSQNPIAYLKWIVFFAAVGFVIGLLLLILRNRNIGSWGELSICLAVCLIFTMVVSINFESSFEGTWVWFSIAGLLLGLLVFLARKIVLKVM